MKPCSTTPGSFRHFAFSGACASASASSNSCVQAVDGTSVMPPSRPFSGRVRTSTCPSARSDDERRAVAHPAFDLRRLARKRLGVAARAGHASVHPGTDAAGRLLRRADRCAEVHHRLGEIAGAALRHQRLGARADFGLGRRQFGLDGVEPRDHPLDVAVDRHRAAVERDRRDRRRGIAADAGQRAQRLLGVREIVRRAARPPPCAQACRLRARA